MKRRRFLTIAAAFACAPRFAEAATWQGRALGSDVSLTLHGPRSETDAALRVLPAWIYAFENEFSLYRPNSALCRLNETGFHAGSARFHTLINNAGQAVELTGGLFDPTIQPLWQALAHGQDPRAVHALIGWSKVRTDPRSIRLAKGQALTLNGIAQGYATDLLRDELRQAGFTKALVNLGEYSALGGPFRLGLSDPIQGHLGTRTLTNTAIATSAPGAMRIGTDPHILAPDGRPPIWSTVSIEAASATLADALSTAAVFMSRDALLRLKHQAALHRITVVDAAGNLTTL